MNERIKSFSSYINELNDAGVRRTYFYELAYASLSLSEGEPVELRRAKAQAYLLDNAPIEVHPYELIAGSVCAFCPVVEKSIPFDALEREAISIIDSFLSAQKQGNQAKTRDKSKIKTFEEEFTTRESRWALMSRVHHDAKLSYPELMRLIELMKTRYKDAPIEPYQIGRELERGLKFDYGEKKKAVDALPWFAANHLSLNYASIMNKGFDALIKDIKARLRTARTGEQARYYNCALIVAEAASRFIQRYAVLLFDTAKEKTSQRRDELIEMANIMHRLSHDKARSFREGLQFVWILHIMMSICQGSALSFGAFDTYMSDLYDADISAGTITRERAYDLLCCMWLKVNEPKMRTVQSLTLGALGATPFTLLCLEVVADTKLPYPNVGFRLNAKSEPALYEAAVRSIAEGAGQPMIMNDDIWVDNLVKLGYSREMAQTYINMGCVEIMLANKQPNWGVTEPIAFPMLFEPYFEKLAAGEAAPRDYAEFERGYFLEIEAAVAACAVEARHKSCDMPGKCFDPLASLMIDGCLDKGADMFQGGAELATHWAFYAYGLGTACDSLAAVKKLVYDDERISLNELIKALECNFSGCEDLRRELSETAPHYGNDIDEADELARRILSCFNEAVFELNSPLSPEKYVSTLFGYFFHIYHGEITGASPNGRLKGMPLSESTGPSQGKDICGPTALLNSSLKLDHSLDTGGLALNIKLSPELIKGKAGLAGLHALIKAYILSGGPQLQFNFVDSETLIKAKKDPQSYRNIIVRVGGFCEYFVNLDTVLQDEIIERTVHG